jgi:hypothetical protein
VVIDDAVQGAWDRVTESWDDAARHEALFNAAVKHNALAWIAGRYRERGDDPIAKAQLERVRKAAVAAMMVSGAARAAKEKTPYRSSLIVLICLMVALLVALFVTKSLHDNHPPIPKPARH